MSFQGPAVQNGNNGYLNISIGNGYNIGIDSNGYLGIFSTTASGTVQELMYFSDNQIIIQGLNGMSSLDINLSNQAFLLSSQPNIKTDSKGNLYVNGGGLLYLGGGIIGLNAPVSFQQTITEYASAPTVAYGLPAIRGEDNRQGLTAADASAITVYTTQSGTNKLIHHLMARIMATAGTSPTATYTVTWVEKGTTISQSLSITATNTPASLSMLIQPDNNTHITAQLTAIGGTGTTVNVATVVEQIAIS